MGRHARQRTKRHSLRPRKIKLLRHCPVWSTLQWLLRTPHQYTATVLVMAMCQLGTQATHTVTARIDLLDVPFQQAALALCCTRGGHSTCAGSRLFRALAKK